MVDGSRLQRRGHHGLTSGNKRTVEPGHSKERGAPMPIVPGQGQLPTCALAGNVVAPTRAEITPPKISGRSAGSPARKSKAVTGHAPVDG